MEEHIKILSNYNLEGYTIETINNNYIIDCKSELFMLHIYKNKRTQLKDFLQFYEDIFNNGFRKLGKIIKTNNGNKYIKTKEKSYFLTSYFREDKNFNYDINFFKDSLNLLSKFHMCTFELKPEKYNLKKEYGKYLKRYLKRIEYMINLKSNLSNNIIKSYFDNQILDILTSYENILSNCKTIFNNIYANRNKSPIRYKFSTIGITIDDFTRVDNKIRLKDLNKIKYCYYHIDIGSLLNSILTLESVNWDYKIYCELIEIYKKNYTFSIEDIYLILAFTIFPYRLYDICRNVYKRQGVRSISNYKQELNSILSQKQQLINWFNYYVEDNDI